MNSPESFKLASFQRVREFKRGKNWKSKRGRVVVASRSVAIATPFMAVATCSVAIATCPVAIASTSVAINIRRAVLQPSSLLASSFAAFALPIDHSPTVILARFAVAVAVDNHSTCVFSIERGSRVWFLEEDHDEAIKVQKSTTFTEEHASGAMAK
ncbi:hypothetical protein DEO72_LG9g2466 [Vigna unguiculata]|uniref:Uncharacterized protein n=1 Tax=Vigna unguiculata TaxID=3917 RepID=A0A4D6N117_VIGUN|nr:hypothetical protein DEO72_LG9g2466 [Vigna unguiculata]